MYLPKTRKQTDESRKWKCRMEKDLRHQGSVDGRPRRATIFRVPVSVREVSQGSYNPKYLSFGPYNRRNSLLYNIRLDFIRIFQKITRIEEWSVIYSEALKGKSTEDWMKLYEGLKLAKKDDGKKKVEENDDGKKKVEEKDDGKKKVEENDAKEEPETFLAWEEGTGESFLVWDAIFVVCFLIADHYRNCRRTCQRYFKFLDSLKNEIEKETVAPLVHLIRLDIFKFENQIPLGIVKNVYDMISSVHHNQASASTARTNDQPSTPTVRTSTPDTELSFDRFVTESVCSIYCDLPKPVDLLEFKNIMPNLGFESRRHLLECLYSVVCYQPNPQPETEPGQKIIVAADVNKPETDQQPLRGTGQLSGNIGKFDALRRPDVELAQISNVGSGADTSGTTQAPPQDDTRKSLQGATGPSQNSNVGGGEGTVSGVQDDKGKSLQSLDAGPPQNSNGGRGEDTSGDRAQRDKGKSLQIQDADPGQNRKGDGGGGTTGEIQRESKGKSREIDATREQDRKGGGGGGTSGEIHSEKGKSPHPGDAGPSQNSNGGSGVGTSRTQHDKGNPPQGHALHSGQTGDEGGAARTWFANLRGCMLTWIFCQGWCSEQEHNHRQFIPTITKLRTANIEVKVGRGNATKWISEVNFRSSWFFSYKGELYLPIFGVYDETEALLRNLLVYEYIVVPRKAELRSFIHLMSNLISDEEDVRWMKESGVLKNNSLGRDQDVADMWKTMLSGVVIPGLSKHYQYEVFDKIAKHRKKTIPKIVGELRLLYNNRWQRFGILAAFVTIVATVGAMIYTILTYYYGNKQRAQT